MKEGEALETSIARERERLWGRTIKTWVKTSYMLGE
jgi:hypothetical protein